MKYLIALIIVAAAIGGFAYLNNDKTTSPEVINGTDTTPNGETVTLNLVAQNNSGMNGVALLRDDNGKTKVTISITGSTGTTSIPAHIHVGMCPTPGAVKYPLTDVTNGASETMLDVKLSDLLRELPLAINLHESAANLSKYVACGDIKNGTGGPAVITPDTTTTTTTSSTGGVNVGVEVGAATAKTVAVSYTDAGFSPTSITINKGDSVNFTNNSSQNMWVASAPHPSHTNYPEFDAKKNVTKGQSYTFTFDKTGTWGFHNHSNPSRFGSVIVK